ncbi:MAG: hypothetical protein KF841_06730 [Phycisphaerae bacterium]|nr:hypothetical protein [Phycisphaerae bacterium]
MNDQRDSSEYQADLIGYHLGLMDENERCGFEDRRGGRAQLSADCSRLERLLEPLKLDRVDSPDGDWINRLIRNIDDACNAGATTLPFPKNALAVPPGQAVTSSGSSLFSIRELTGLAAAIVMFAGILVPGFYTARQTAQRVACANNLRMIGGGAESYAQMFDNTLPFAGPIPADARWAAASESAQPVRNSRHLYRLVLGQLVPPEAFVCAGVESDRPMNVPSFEDYDDFLDPRNNSYATNFTTQPFAHGDFLPAMPMAACMTPLVDQNRRLLPADSIRLNSMNHGRTAGQNVLRANVSVQFFNTPNCGLFNDDIYRVQGVNEYTGKERPRAIEDAFLVP